MRPSLPWVAFVVLTCAISSFAGDSGRWTFFHPEAVTNLSCKVQMVSMQHGPEKSGEAWVADATATRNDPSLGDWHATIAEFLPNVKGRHSAENACSKWMDEASKRVRAAK